MDSRDIGLLDERPIPKQRVRLELPNVGSLNLARILHGDQFQEQWTRGGPDIVCSSASMSLREGTICLKGDFKAK